MKEQTKKCCCPCHKIGIGVLLILVGALFLLKNLGMIDEHLMSILWPSLIILAGLKKALGGMCKCCPGACNEKP